VAKVLVSMPDEFLSLIDKFAENEQRSRSELIREALRGYIRKNNIINTNENEKRAKVIEELLK